MDYFTMPSAIADLAAAQAALCEHYKGTGLTFTFDGKLVGDIGEAIAAELFDIRLLATHGYDGHAPDGRTVQIKASGRGGGPAFRCGEARAEHLICMLLDFKSLSGEIIYNGPEDLVVATIPTTWTKGQQRQASVPRIRAIYAQLPDSLKLPRRDLPQGNAALTNVR